MTKTFINGRILLGETIIEDHGVLVDNGRVKSVLPNAQLPKGGETVDLRGTLLAPGFVDIQVNGGGGCLFNDDPTVDTIAAIGAAHQQYGTTGFLPTFISDDLDRIPLAIQAVDAAICQGVRGVLGIHLEGPFLNPIRKGVHDQDKFRTLLAEHIPMLTALKTGKTLITLAPEQCRPDIISALTQAGAIVSIGHSNANYNQAKRAIENGVRGFTHLFNAMPPLTSREPGVIGVALEDQNTWCGIIVDGHHVSPINLKLALRCKPVSRFMLVTDAMPTVGHARDSFCLQGKTVHVENGVCKTINGTLAGSNLNMAQAVRNTMHMLKRTCLEASQMASLNPAQFLGLEESIGHIGTGCFADFVSLDEEYNVVNTWIRGEL